MSGEITPREDVHDVFKAEMATAGRLVHLIPDQLAATVPDYPLFSYPRATKLRDGFVDISAQRFANAINRTSWYLSSLLGPPKDFDSVGYMGPNDIRYFLFMFGAIKVGYKMLFLSPRNNLEGHLNVLAGADCHAFLHASGTQVGEILAHRKMQTSVVPALADLMDESPVDAYPYTKTFEEARMDPCLVLHTTGSTGLPKPITWKLGILSTYEAWRTVPPVDGYVPTTVVYQQARRMYTSLPLFHTSGLNAGITWALLLGVTLVYGAPWVVPNAAFTDEMHRYAQVDASIGAPSIYEELSRDTEALERMGELKYIVASGAPLSQRAGALISQKTRIISNLGSTETACLQRLSPSVQDWDYFYWHPTHSGIEMRQFMEHLYELFIVRKPGLELYQGIFTTFPHISEWSMSDLYERHPDPAKPFLYRYKGRKDDVIVLSNGEKLVPALMEATLRSSPLVQGAMVVGRGRFQPAAVIDLGKEPPGTVKERQTLVEELLPVISEANEHAPAHGQLDQYHILFADPKRPIHYLGQGKIQRYLTHELYAKDIEELYEAAENPEDQTAWRREARLDFNSEDALRMGLQALVSELTGVQGLQGHQDLFEAGLDSLHVIRLARELRLEARNTPCLERTALKELSPRAIYKHPSLDDLASFIVQATRNDSAADVQGASHDKPTQRQKTGSGANGLHAVGNSLDQRRSDVRLMQKLLGKYVDSLPKSSRTSQPPRLRHMTVLLTGSTGSLGSYILDALDKNAGVARIICLNRAENAAERQGNAAAQRGLNMPKSGRVEFFKADLSKTYFGLEEAVYRRMSGTVTHIIHNQWPVNFNWSVSSFEPHIRGARNLAYFAATSTHNAFLLFVSSVSSVGSWKQPGSVPEEVVHDLSVAAPMGYGQSKLIAECLLDKAAQISGVRSACCRVGIVAGPVERRQGMWNKHEYMPSLIISSAHLGLFPCSIPGRDRVDWLPVDKVSQILIEIMTRASLPQISPAGTKVFHVVNPHWASWSDGTARAILDAYPRTIQVRPVPFDVWVDGLRQSVDDADVDGNPAVRLVDFYAGLASASDDARSLACPKAEMASATLRNAGPVHDAWLRNWMAQWALRPRGVTNVMAGELVPRWRLPFLSFSGSNKAH